MSETKHTPGPWVFDGYIVTAPKHGYITRDISVCRLDASTMAAFDQKANGRLIAAAPELLALVKRYRAETPLGHQPHMIAGDVDAIIAKAEGKS